MALLSSSCPDVAPRGRATCRHANRRAHNAAGQCKECATWGRIDTAYRPPQPAAVLGVAQQYASATVPATCPKCGAGTPSWDASDNPLYVMCLSCGRDWYRLGALVVRPPTVGRGARL